ncbi:MAG: hypothetical protein LBU04_04475 [Christensenellaceae bacterium]|jgi:hypothetical protein|nr:hypothetical protein [Christensenellaceae bacterium]
MKSERKFNHFVVLVAMMLFVLFLVGCSPYEGEANDPNSVDHTSSTNLTLQYPSQTEERKNAMVDRTTDAMDALLAHLDSDATHETGYYMGADITINTFDAKPEERSAFRLKLRANLYTYPYEKKDADGNVIMKDGLPEVDQEALAIHNQLIKNNDIILEWFDAMTNQMLIGFYFDGINPNSADKGNHLYLNLLGSKRIFLNFGDSVLYQQIVRLITHFDLNTIVSGGESDDPQYVGMFNTLLKTAIRDNYKEVINGDITSLFYYGVDLSAIRGTLTEELQGFFSPFKDRFDPLTNKYLGFKFSTLGSSSFESIISDMQFLVSKPMNNMAEMLTGVVLDVSGSTLVQKKLLAESVPFESHIDVNYELRISTNIVIDKTDYVVYNYGGYEFRGDLWLPSLGIEMDALIRTDINEYDPENGLFNDANRVWAEFYDQSNQNVLIGLYYKDELTYINIKDLMDMYGGGIQVADLGLPQAYKSGIDLASMLTMLFDLIDEYIVIAVDSILMQTDPNDTSDSFTIITSAITDNMVSTMKDPDIPSSRNTMKISIDIELIRLILREVYGTTYTNELMINLLNEMIGINLEEIALILGVDVSILIDSIYVDITYDVDEYKITMELRMLDDPDSNEEGALILRLNLTPTHVGEEIIISFPQFDNYKPLQEIQTYSATIGGQIIFAKKDNVDLSNIIGGFIGDLSGKNTPYILPNEANIYFTLQYDMYIRDQELANKRWVRAGRSAISASIYIYNALGERVDLVRVYANDVSFDSASPVDELGYLWVEILCVPNMPKMKVKEDLFLESFNQLLGGEATDEEGVIVSPTTIIQALMEDSWPVFEPEVIRITTSNKMFKNLFNVDELIADITLQVGFKQRVFNIDELEDGFAMYSVGELTNLTGETLYDIKLHETITVYFDFGTRQEVKEFIIDYDPVSISIAHADGNFYPATNGQFMGGMRAYRVTVGSKAVIIELVTKHIEYEPIGSSFPTIVSAYYGEGLRSNYRTVTHDFYAYFDREIGYYVLNDYSTGYKIFFDPIKKAYIIDLGENAHYDVAIKRLAEYGAAMYPAVFSDAKSILSRLMPPNATQDELDAIDPNAIYQESEYSIFPRVFTDRAQNEYTYILNPDWLGYYIVTTQLTSPAVLLIYDSIRERYIAYDDSVVSRLVTLGIIPPRSIDNPDDPEVPIIVQPKIIPLNTEITSFNKTFIAVYDLVLGYYCITAIKDGLVISFDLIYGFDEKRFYVKDSTDLESATALGISAVVLSSINWHILDNDASNWAQINWNQKEYFRNINYETPSWETMTLEGGLFYVEIVIGPGMMATYKELITMLVTNRTVDTNKYINVNVYYPDSDTSDMSRPVKAPVIDYIEIDPYVYILAEADYKNNVFQHHLDGYDVDLGDNFIAWYFRKYIVNLKFTDIYGNENDTVDLRQSFTWSFEYYDKDSSFNEQNISNHADEEMSTFVVTTFNGQLIALEIRILPRIFDHLEFAGETKNNTYTVDALDTSTYKIPTNPTLYFIDGKGGVFTINFDALDDPQRSSAFVAAGISLSPEFTIRGKSIKFVTPKSDEISNYVIADAIINWSNPVANNVFTAGNKNQPFKESTKNITTAYINFKSYVAPDRMDGSPDVDGEWYPQWFPDDWFATPLLTITVEVPDKTVKMLDYSSTYFDIPLVHNVSISGIENENGLFFVDPYDKKDKKLPSSIKVYFDNNDGYTEKTYDDVEWAGDCIEVVDGYYKVKNVTHDNRKYFTVTTRIGDEGSAGIELTIVIVKLSGVIQAYQFLNSENNVVIGSNEVLPEYMDLGYQHEVDTFSRFDLPISVKLYFDVGEPRSYNLSWSAVASEYGFWSYGLIGPGTTPRNIKATIGDDIELNFNNASTYKYVPMTFIIIGRALLTGDSAVDNLVLTEYSDTNHGGSVTFTDLGWGTRDHSDPSWSYSSTLVIDGIDFSKSTMADQNPFDYFVGLLSHIRLTLNAGRIGTPFPGFTGSFPAITLDVTDALNKYGFYGSIENYDITRTFDTKLAMSSAGFSFIIHLGQGIGAYDCQVTIKNMKGFDIVSSDGEWATVSVSPYDPRTGLPQYGYDKPYVFLNELEIEVAFYGDMVKVETPKVWYVHSLGNPAIPIEIGDELTELDWDTLTAGGSATITSMLKDGSRIYRTIAIVGLTITKYGAEHELYTITPYEDGAFIGGIVIIDTIYLVYPDIMNLTSDSLPSEILSQDNIVVHVPAWTIMLNLDSLDVRPYRWNIPRSQHVVFATAMVLGNEIKLYVEILPSVITQIEYIAAGNRGYKSEDVAGESEFVRFDAYEKSDYAGILTLPNAIKLTFDSGKSYLYELPLVYSSAGLNITSIPYTYTGHTFSFYNSNRVEVNTTLIDGQPLSIVYQFYNKTVDHITINGKQVDDTYKYEMNPYGTRELPVNVEVHFSSDNGGDPYNYTVPGWTLLAGSPAYDLRYDTYRRVLAPYGLDKFIFTSSLSSTGLASQTLTLNIGVSDMVADVWSIDSSYVDVSGQRHTSEMREEISSNATNPVSYYHFDDIFAESAKDLPQKISLPSGSRDLSQLLSFNIVWDFDDSRITASGQAGNGLLVTGYIADPAYGQPVKIRVFVSTWRFVDIRKQIGADKVDPKDNEYQIMDTVKVFTFSLLDDSSISLSYQLVLYKSNPLAYGRGGAAVNETKSVVFYPEERSDINSSYRVIWDKGAMALLAQVPSSEVTAFASLGNLVGDVLINKLSIQGTIRYQYDMPVISSLEFEYSEGVYAGLGGRDEVMYVVNPLAPVLGTKARAYGNKGETFNLLLGIVEVVWPVELTGANRGIVLDQYLKGGLRRVRVAITLTVNDGELNEKNISSDFDVIILFLDMTPKTPIRVAASSAGVIKSADVTEFYVRTLYANNTYSGVVNPYRNSYTTNTITMLNFGVTNLLEVSLGSDYKLMLSNIGWDTSAPVTSDGDLSNPSAINTAIFIYVMKCSITSNHTSDIPFANCSYYYMVEVTASI